MTKIKPFEKQGNFTMVHNFVIDYMMPRLSANGFRVLIFAIRKTTGWQKEQDVISYSQFLKGTGIKSYHTISKAISELLDAEYLLRIEQRVSTNLGKPSYAYMLNMDYEIDTDLSADNAYDQNPTAEIARGSTAEIAVSPTAKTVVGPTAKTAYTKETKERQTNGVGVGINQSELEPNFDPAVVDELVKFGITQSVARELSLNTDYETATAWMAYTHKANLSSPAGFVVSKLRQGERPPGVERTEARKPFEQIAYKPKRTEAESVWREISSRLEWMMAGSIFETNFQHGKAECYEDGILTVKVSPESLEWIHNRLLLKVEEACSLVADVEAVQFIT
jgi:phage replication O-like protein O